MRRVFAVALVAGLGLVLFFVWRERSGDVPAGTHEPGLEAEQSPTDLTPVAPSVEPALGSAEERREEAEAEARAAAERARAMRVRVVGAADGRPVAQAEVTLFDRATPGAQLTDEAGIAFVERGRPGATARLQVTAAGFSAWAREVALGSELRVELRRVVSMFGEVRAAHDGTPVPGAELVLEPVECEDCEPLRTRADALGTYELAGVPLRGPAVLEVRAPGFASERRLFELHAAEARVQQDLELTLGTEFAGRVEDWSTGRGLGGARVATLTTDAEGRFHGPVAAHPATGVLGFEASAPEHVGLRGTVVLPLANVPVLRLPRHAYIEGQVTDAAGVPLGGARVRFDAEGPMRAEDGSLLGTSPLYELPDGWSYADDEVEAVSDAGGLFRIAVPPWSLGARLVVDCAGFEREERDLPVLGEPDSVRRTDLRMRLARGPTEVGGIVTLDGRASAAFTGRVTWEGGTRSGAVVLEGGDFHAEVEPGSVRLAAELDLLPGVRAREVVVELLPGQQLALELAVTAPVELAATISGAVLFDDGRPAAGFEVEARATRPGDEGASLIVGGTTDSAGEFTLDVLDVGLDYEVEVLDFRDRYASFAGVRPGTRGLDIVLPSARRVLARVRDAHGGGALVLDEEVQLFARTDPRAGFWRLSPVSGLPDAGGWQEFWLEAGEVDLLALPLGGELGGYGSKVALRVELERDSPTRVDLALEWGVELIVRVSGESGGLPGEYGLYLVEEELGDELGSARVTQRGPQSVLAERALVVFDEEGRGVVRGLAAGGYRLLVFPEGVRVVPERVEVDAGTREVVVGWEYRE